MDATGICNGGGKTNYRKDKILFSDIDLSNAAYTVLIRKVVSKMSENEIHVMIRSTPEGYRTVFNLSVIEGYSHEEIAFILSIQPTTSRGQLIKSKKIFTVS